MRMRQLCPAGPQEVEVDVDLLARDPEVDVQLRTLEPGSVDEGEKQLLQSAASDGPTWAAPADERPERTGPPMPSCSLEHVLERVEVEQAEDPPLLVVATVTSIWRRELARSPRSIAASR